MPENPRFGWRVLLASTALAAIAAGMVVVLFSGSDDGSATDTTAPPTIKIDDEPKVDADTVTFTDFDGKDVLLSSLKGTPTVINFFASTCTPCITEMPDLERVHQQLGTRVAFLGLALQDRIDASKDLIRRTGITYRTARDSDAHVFQLFDGTVLPMTVLLDANGTVVATHSGQLTADQLRALVTEKLGITP
jgi:thiol-disulfide isomerase/thioredoxin